MMYCVSVVLILLVAILNNVNSIAVMSVDLGTEWMKIGVVSPGVPMEIVLNRESKRKTPVAVAFRDDERVFGEDAMNLGVRYPKNNYFYLLDLLGKPFDHPLVQLFHQKFPYYEIEPDPETGMVRFRHDSETSFLPEELLGMILAESAELASKFAEQVVKDVVLTVPVFFSQAERRSVLRAAQLAGLKVLQLMNDNTAAALNYGIFRRKEFNESQQRIMLFDMGASSTVATVVGYQVVKTKERGFVETNPQLALLGIGFDRTLGGLEFTLRLRDHLAKTFNDQKKISSDILSSPRAMSKLFKEAGRLKHVLSANVEHTSQVEGLLDDTDFRALITRNEFETMCGDLFDRINPVITMALETASLTLADIDQVILVGAGTRVPKVQEKIQESVGVELGKSLNTDEAAAMGAAYKAADLGTGFKVKKFVTKDAVVFPIQVDFQREAEDENHKAYIKSVRRALFPPMNLYPQKKVMTFNRHTDDFVFNVNYGELEKIPKVEIGYLGSLNLSKVSVSGVKEALEKHSQEDSKGIKAHFNLDGNGLLVLTHAEAVFEHVEVPQQENNQTDDESTFSKLGSTISQLFSTGDSEEKQEQQKEQKEEEKKAEEEKKSEKTEKKSNDTKEAKKPEGVKPKIVTVKELLMVVEEKLDFQDPNQEQFQISLEKIKAMDEADKAKKKREAARNGLEGFCTDVQDKLYQMEYEAASTDEEREKLRSACSEISDWLYEDGFDAATEVFEEKLNEMKALSSDLWKRVKEHADRPDAIAALKDMLNASRHFLLKAKQEDIFTEVEISVLEKLINETKNWLKEKIEEQSKTSLTNLPVLTIRMIAEKLADLDREIKYLINKATVKKRKEEEEKLFNKTTTTNTTKNDTDSKTDKKSAKEETQEDEKTADDNEYKFEEAFEDQREEKVADSGGGKEEEEKVLVPDTSPVEEKEIPPVEEKEIPPVEEKEIPPIVDEVGKKHVEL